MDVRTRLLEKADPEFKKFSEKLNPGIGNILGVRTPAIREIAKEIIKDDWRSNLENNPTDYFEERAVRSFVISTAKMDLSERIGYIRDYIPLIDCWALCDIFCFKPKAKEKEEYWNFVIQYLDRPGEFEKRFAVVTMMGEYLDDEHIDNVLRLLNEVKHDGYYLKMGVAWALSFCFIKYPDKTMALLKNNDLDKFTYNKALQKIVESYRVNAETKEVIRSMKRK